MVEPRAPAETGVSDREAEVLSLVGAHLSNAQIANRLVISVRTVESHVSSLLRKLEVASRKELAQLAASYAGDLQRQDDVLQDAGVGIEEELLEDEPEGLVAEAAELA